MLENKFIKSTEALTAGNTVPRYNSFIQVAWMEAFRLILHIRLRFLKVSFLTLIYTVLIYLFCDFYCPLSVIYLVGFGKQGLI